MQSAWEAASGGARGRGFAQQAAGWEAGAPPTKSLFSRFGVEPAMTMVFQSLCAAQPGSSRAPGLPASRRREHPEGGQALNRAMASTVPEVAR